MKRLALIAAKHDINFTMDAEEADRLALSLKLLDALAHEPDLGDWKGLGLAVQAYQKRGPEVIAAEAGCRGLVLDGAEGLAVGLDKAAQQDISGDADDQDQHKGQSGKPGDKAFQEPHGKPHIVLR